MAESKTVKKTGFCVACPICGKKVPWGPQSPWRPFCSERCRLVDLGEWGSGGYRIEGAPGSADKLEGGSGE